MIYVSINIFVIIFLLTCTMKNNLVNNIDNWKSIGASNTVLQWIEHGIQFPLVGEIDSFEFTNRVFSRKEQTFLHSEISDLLLLGCVEHVAQMCISHFMCA